MDKIIKLKYKLFLRMFLFLIGFFLIVFSFYKNKVLSKNVIKGDVIFLLDVSNSMNVEDVFYNAHKTSRLELAKKIIENHIQNSNLKYGVILFSDKIDYFLPSTKDKKNFLTYLKTINTNNLDGGNMNFVKSINSIKKVLNPTDAIILMSDFDTNENLNNIQLKNPLYIVGIGTERGGIVKNKDNEVLYKNGEALYSKLNKNKVLELKNKAIDYTILDTYKKGDILSFVKELDKNIQLTNSNKIDYVSILGFICIILAF